MTEALYLVDASIYVFRSYYSIPDTFHARNGELVNAVYGYTQFLLDLLDRKPELISVAFDESLTTCYRNDIYPEYKANRALPDKNLEFQLKQCQEITRLLGLHSLCLKDFEADDIIGTLLAKFGKNRQAIIVTRDKDLGQLLRKEDRLWDFAADVWSGPAEIEAKFGVTPLQLADFLALAGDSVDNIPGVPGIGAKTAAALLSQFGSLEELIENVEELPTVNIRGAAKLKSLIEGHVDQIRVYREITEINCAVPMEVALDDLAIAPMAHDELDAFCDAMLFGNRVRARIAKLYGE